VTLEVAVPVRPTWRGLLHRVAAPVFAGAFVALVGRADTGGDRVAMVVYGCGVTAMLAVSAVYHSGRPSAPVLRALKRVDHSTILFAIAGTYTGMTAVALAGDEERRMLWIIWVAAVVGIAIRMVWLDAPYPLVAVVYLAVGWLMVVDLPAYLRGMSDGATALVVAGGLLYTVGGVVYAAHRPNPWPTTFGYHEVFHALVVGGAACHYAAVWVLLA
jgi:hemolysin III